MLNHLPCRIESTGLVEDFEEYFDENAAINTFRGRVLKGKEIDLKANNFAALLIEKDDNSMIDESKRKEAKILKVYNSVKYWKHDDEPDVHDALNRITEWMKLARVLSENGNENNSIKNVNSL